MVKYVSPTCSPCETLSPILDRVVAEYEGQILRTPTVPPGRKHTKKLRDTKKIYKYSSPFSDEPFNQPASIRMTEEKTKEQFIW